MYRLIRAVENLASAINRLMDYLDSVQGEEQAQERVDALTQRVKKMTAGLRASLKEN